MSAFKKKPKKENPAGLWRFFLRGVVTLAPVVLTLVVFGLLYQMVDRYITGPITSAICFAFSFSPTL